MLIKQKFSFNLSFSYQITLKHHVNNFGDMQYSFLNIFFPFINT
jgi:hypothetical protein